MGRLHVERHHTDRIGWLRAAVLGANDGIVSTASLVLGVAAADVSRAEVLLAGTAGLVAGAMSMATGEYVSVHSQADTERAELERERHELSEDPVAEQKELANIYVQRGLKPALAREVASQLMAWDAEGAHARDELGISEASSARPFSAAVTSALSFSLGAGLPLALAALVPLAWLPPFIGMCALVSLASLGALAAKLGGAKVGPAVARISFWGAMAMALTTGVGALFGVAA